MLGAAIGVGLLMILSGIFVATKGFDMPAHPLQATLGTVSKKGNFGKYLYSITDIATQRQKLAQFDPTLPTDDSVVITVLKLVARDGYNFRIPDEVPPVVESLNETNYVTFIFGGRKIYFELFRNSNGQVGSARFWL